MIFRHLQLSCAAFLVTSFCIQESFQQEKDPACSMKCKEKNKWQYRLQDGEYVCITVPKAGMYVMEDPCRAACQGTTVDEDQTKCFCEACKQFPHNYKDYCLEPYTDPINGKEECDTLVCTGQAKYRGKLFCNAKAKRLKARPPQPKPEPAVVAVPATETPQAEKESTVPVEISVPVTEMTHAQGEPATLFQPEPSPNTKSGIFSCFYMLMA